MWFSQNGNENENVKWIHLQMNKDFSKMIGRLSLYFWVILKPENENKSYGQSEQVDWWNIKYIFSKILSGVKSS